MIRVLLADDQALVRGAFAALVNSADDTEVVAEAVVPTCLRPSGWPA